MSRPCHFSLTDGEARRYLVEAKELVAKWLADGTIPASSVERFNDGTVTGWVGEVGNDTVVQVIEHHNSIPDFYEIAFYYQDAVEKVQVKHDVYFMFYRTTEYVRRALS